MRSIVAHAFVLVPIAFSWFVSGVGCSSTSGSAAGPGVGMSDAQSDVSAEAGAALCAGAGGECRGSDADGFTTTSCALVGPENACNADKQGGTFCCAIAGPDGGSCKSGTIVASSYDLSCTTDSDCVVVSEGNSCDLCAFVCPNATISAGAQARYMADVADTTAFISTQRAACSVSCGVMAPVCCVAGQCRVTDGSQCVGPNPVTDASADAVGPNPVTDASADAVAE